MSEKRMRIYLAIILFITILALSSLSSKIFLYIMVLPPTFIMNILRIDYIAGEPIGWVAFPNMVGIISIIVYNVFLFYFLSYFIIKLIYRIKK